MLGVLALTAAWVAAGLRREGYDPVELSISQLQRAGTPGRALVSAGLVCCGLGLLAVAALVGRAVGSPATTWLLRVAGAVTLGAAAFPLAETRGGATDPVHMACAAVGYVALAVLPLVGGLALQRSGRAGARTAYGVGVLASVCLALTVPLHDVSGGLQRVGLTSSLAWVCVTAVQAARSSGVRPACGAASGPS